MAVVVIIWLSWCMGRVVPGLCSRLPAPSPESHTAYLAWVRCRDEMLNRRGVYMESTTKTVGSAYTDTNLSDRQHLRGASVGLNSMLSTFTNHESP